MTQPSLDLVADVGGTNTRVALVHAGHVKTSSITRISNRDHTSLETLLAFYLDKRGAPDIARACVAMAGPVADGTGTMTNLNWSLSQRALARATGAQQGIVINDLQAQGHAIGHLAPDALLPVHGTIKNPLERTCLVIGLGTGFNSAMVLHTSAGRLVPPAESGHADLPTPAPEDWEFTQYMNGTQGFASIEDALSGPGLEALYEWHASGTHLDAPEVIAACTQANPDAVAALRQFTRLLGTVCANLALGALPVGGIYLVGGVARSVAPHLSELGFSESYVRKGRFSEFVAGFGVCAVNDDFAALKGCAALLDASGFTSS